MAKKKKSVQIKEQPVLRLIQGEDMEWVSRDTGFAMHELSQWRTIQCEHTFNIKEVSNVSIL